MNYPVWELGFGSGLLIAIIAVFHVFVSHFAIGGGFFITVSEYFAYKRNDQRLLDFVKITFDSSPEKAGLDSLSTVLVI